MCCRAPEPADIRWEHIQQRGWRRFLKLLPAAAAALVVCGISLGFQFGSAAAATPHTSTGCISNLCSASALAKCRPSSSQHCWWHYMAWFMLAEYNTMCRRVELTALAVALQAALQLCSGHGAVLCTPSHGHHACHCVGSLCRRLQRCHHLDGDARGPCRAVSGQVHDSAQNQLLQHIAHGN